MTDRTTNGLQGCLSSLAMSVAPSAAGDPLAREQVALLARYLRFASQRVERIHERARFELAWYAAMASAAQGVLRGDDASSLNAPVAAARAALVHAGTTTIELQRRAMDLQSALAGLVRRARTFDIDVRRPFEHIVCQHSAPIVRMHRAWFAPQGWESGSLPSLDEALTHLPPLNGSDDSPQRQETSR